MLKCMLIAINFSFLLFEKNSAEEAGCIINGKRSLHVVSDKFLSFTIDPGAFLTGINISSSTYVLAKHLGPAYIRLSGPSTRTITFLEDQPLRPSSIKDTSWPKFEVTPSMWKSLNKWLNDANLTPVFALSDNDRINGLWNAKSYLPLLDLTDKSNASCYWQLGYGRTNKTKFDYLEDYMTLRNIMDAFPKSKGNWKIAASDFQDFLKNNVIENVRHFLDDLYLIADVAIWHQYDSNSKEFPEKDVISRLLSSPVGHKYPIWIVAPKFSNTGNIESAILWAKELGEAAKLGYEVIFRQLKLHEMFSDTPAYWVSFLHKKLMGRNVLDIKLTTFQTEVFMYAHCSKHQNNYSKSGALTILATNNLTVEYPTAVRIIGSYASKSLEIQCYILSSANEFSTEIYFNEERLSMNILKEDEVVLHPKLRRVRMSKYFLLNLPPKSVGFYVLPGARVPVCIQEEQEADLLMDELNRDQKLDLQDIATNENRKKLLELLDSHEKEEKESSFQENDITKELKIKNLTNAPKIVEKRSQASNITKATIPEFRNKSNTEAIQIRLSSDEIYDILKRRVKAKATEKGLHLQEDDLQKIIRHVFDNFRVADNVISVKPKEDAILSRTKREIKRDENLLFSKRDINMELLRKKTKGQRIPINSNKELFASNESTENSSQTDVVFAEIMEDEERKNGKKNRDFFRKTSFERTKTRKNGGNNIFNIKPSSLIVNPKGTQKKEKPMKNWFERFFEFSEESEEDYESFDKSFEYLPNIGYNSEDNYEFTEFDESTSFENYRSTQTDYDDDESNMSYDILRWSKDKIVRDGKAKQLEGYFKEIEELRRSKLFGHSSPYSQEDCEADSLELKSLDNLRLKRDVTDFTEEDIQKYMRFMVEQLKYMRIMQREARLRRQADRNLRKRNTPKSNVPLLRKKKNHHIEIEEDKHKENSTDYLLTEPVKITIGKPYDSEKVNINEKQRKAQIQMLKNRLMRRRKVERRHDDVNKNEQEAGSNRSNILEVQNGSNELKKYSSIDTKADRKSLFDNWSIRSKRFSDTRKLREDKDSFKNTYKRLTPIREWKAQDILTLRRNSSNSTSRVSVSDLPPLTAKPIFFRSFEEPKVFSKRYRRQVEEIDNEILKDDEIKQSKKYLVPKFESNVKLLKSKINVTKGVQRESQWKLVNNGSVSLSKRNESESSTDENTNDVTNVLLVNEEQTDNIHETDFGLHNGTILVDHQPLVVITGSDKANNFLSNVLNTFESFIVGLTSKVSEYMEEIGEKLLGY